VLPAHQPGPHPGEQEGVRVPLVRVQPRGEAVQGPVHAGRAHEAPHRRETPQMYRK